ncbi:DUF2627 domain-containing protein [Thalassorhabdus alkalitolerans]|uniref:DUF2627 domain-containing protein n=1 Tax=Thalassorhabdus alkalitolerans TaxID=2282697 RepID=A0ABW0YT92_9BACI|nr:DUF2627 domain-containing protein [Bacillus sp. FJAT-44742]
MRTVALMMLVIPGVIAGLGIKLMRDLFFNILHPPFPFLWVQFLVGLIIFVMGIAFIAGFVLHRDRKNNKVGPRFQKKQKKEVPAE